MTAVDIRPGVDVIVVDYKTPEDLAGFLDSLRLFPAQVPVTVHVCEVSPNPGQPFPDMQGIDEFSYYSYQDNVGYAYAVNAAGVRGSREVLAIFNADVRLTEGALDRCYEALVSNDQWGVLGPLQTDERGRVTHGGIFGTNENPHMVDWLRPVSEQNRVVREAVTVSGAAYFMKRALWDELSRCETFRTVFPDSVGAFLPTPFYYEETGCSYHTTAHGWKVIYYGAVQITHKWHASVKSNDMERQASRWMTQSREMFRNFCKEHEIACD